MSRPPSPDELRHAIADALADYVKAYELTGACDGLGLPPAPPGTEPMDSKRIYARSRLAGRGRDDLVEVARQVIDEYGANELERYLSGIGVTGVDGEVKNLIFAADGPKPRIVLRDAVNNVIEIVDNAQYCLVYDRSLPAEGLTWSALVDWWRHVHGSEVETIEAGRHLYNRLRRSLQSEAEKLLFHTYCARHATTGGFDLPALVPQVYLHYDPYTKAELAPSVGPLPRQRMDFLMLLPERSRVVIEIDGRQHYASGENLETPDPRRYAEMVSEDRTLRLRGYEVYRFGNAELTGHTGTNLLRAFFDALLERHRV